jgi:hypothetical protein
MAVPKLTRALIHGAMPVLLGAAMYVAWRSQRLLVFEWLTWFGLSPSVATFRHALASYPHQIPDAIMYSLPDALWVYAFTSVLVLIWMENLQSKWARSWIALPTLLGVGGEIGQKFGFIPGTFDWNDCAAYLLAGLLGLFLSRLKFQAGRVELLGA